MNEFVKTLTKICIIIVLAFCFSSISFASDKVAVFDFDDRSKEINPNAQFIEKKISEIDKKIFVDHYNAKSDEETAIKMLKEIDEKNYRLVITITTDALRIASHMLQKTPFLFTNVNNPGFMGINLEKPGRNRSGVTYYAPVKEHMEIIKIIVPSLQKIGFIFDYQNASRRMELGEARTYCNENNIEFVASLIKTDQEIETATNKLISEKVDVIVITSSGKIYDNTDRIAAIADKNKIPIYSYNKKAVSKGAIASLSIGYEDLINDYLMPMVKKVLKENINPGNIPIGFPKKFDVYLNVTKAKKIGLTLNNQITKIATEKF